MGIHRTSTRKYLSVGEHSSEGLSENQHLYNATPLLPKGTPQYPEHQQGHINGQPLNRNNSSQQGLTEHLLLHALYSAISSGNNNFGNISNASNLMSWPQALFKPNRSRRRTNVQTSIQLTIANQLISASSPTTIADKYRRTLTSQK